MARHLQSESFNRKKRIRRWIGGVSLAVAIASFFFIASSVLNLSSLMIQGADVFGADPAISGAVHDLVISQLKGDYLGIFPRSNALIYPKQSIIAAIQREFPRVLDVTIDQDSLNHIRVGVDEKIPKAVVCVTLPNFNGNILSYNPTDPCYMADRTGFLFEKSPAISGHDYHVYYAPEVALNAASSDYIGSYATTTAEFASLQAFYDGAVSAGIGVDGILIKDGGEYELYASSTVIYFNDEEGLSDELLNLVAFWRHMMAPSPGATAAPSFDYIDLRYSPNVFYKLLPQ